MKEMRTFPNKNKYNLAYYEFHSLSVTSKYQRVEYIRIGFPFQIV